MTEPSLAALQQRFNRPGLISIEAGQGGLTRIVATPQAASAELYLHGGHLTHFQPRGEEPVLFLSSRSFFEPGKPIRGGIPLCWPWFAQHPTDPSKPMHGFARLQPWNLEAVHLRGDGAELWLGLSDSLQTLALFPHAFKANLKVSIQRKLTLSLEITNLGREAFTFTEAFHPYFRVADVRHISIDGLQHTSYLEKIESPEIQKEGNQPLQFTRRTDRVYYDTRKPIIISDPGMKRRIIQTKDSSDTTVVWNPWDQWPLTVPDFAPDEWPAMVCVEPSNAHHFALNLEPGQSHTMGAVIEVTRI